MRGLPGGCACGGDQGRGENHVGELPSGASSGQRHGRRARYRPGPGHGVPAACSSVSQPCTPPRPSETLAPHGACVSSAMERTYMEHPTSAMAFDRVFNASRLAQACDDVRHGKKFLVPAHPVKHSRSSAAFSRNASPWLASSWFIRMRDTVGSACGHCRARKPAYGYPRNR